MHLLHKYMIEEQGSSDHLNEFSRINVGSNIVQQASDELWIRWKIGSTLCVENDWCISTDPIIFTIALPVNTLLHYTLPWFCVTTLTTTLYQQSSTWLYSIQRHKNWEYGDTCKPVVTMTVINLTWVVNREWYQYLPKLLVSLLHGKLYGLRDWHESLQAHNPSPHSIIHVSPQVSFAKQQTLSYVSKVFIQQLLYDTNTLNGIVSH